MEPHQTLFDLEGIRRAKDHIAAEQARFGSQLIDVSVKSFWNHRAEFSSGRIYLLDEPAVWQMFAK